LLSWLVAPIVLLFPRAARMQPRVIGTHSRCCCSCYPRWFESELHSPWTSLFAVPM